MTTDQEIIKITYSTIADRINKAKEVLKRPLTLAEKILYAHLFSPDDCRDFRRGRDYVNFRPDRVAMQDATAQMALLQLMNSGKDKSSVPASVHCDHLITAHKGASEDLAEANFQNKEVYDFLKSVSDKYGIGFWNPGSGIIHQVILENYAFPGGMMIGTDSHTPNAGGLGMIAIGVGGSDAVDVMTGMEWELKMPEIIGVRLTGKLSGWASPKDVILKLAGILTVKGGTNCIIEYFGSGVKSLSATGRATICNMGAEVGATTSIFPFDEKTKEYLTATGREYIAINADKLSDYLKADREIENEPEKYFDRVIEINLNELEPHINGPFTPDAATSLSQFARKVRAEGLPQNMEAGLIGSCTNSSYQDISRAASLAKQAVKAGLKCKASLIINPGSEMIRRTAQRDGLLEDFEALGATIMANACGPCIGQWTRETDDPARKNSVVTSFNRNFAKRVDGNPNTYAFVASPEITLAFALAGDLTFNPMTDSLLNTNGEHVKLSEPHGDTLPVKGFAQGDNGFCAPTGKTENVLINPSSERLQKLEPFPKLNNGDFKDMPLLIKTSGKCTTDHISMAGPWLRYRGHLENISGNLLMGAVNSFNGETNKVLNTITKGYDKVSTVAKYYKEHSLSSVVVAEDNYGEGSSREHAAMEPRFMNVKAIIAKSFARIHETNLKKQGMLAATFAHPEDYKIIGENDLISIEGLDGFAPGKQLTAVVKHADGSSDIIELNHTYNEMQIGWFKAGSALNYLKSGK